MKFKLFIDGKEIGVGFLCVLEDGSAQFASDWTQEHKLAGMQRTGLGFVNLEGIQLSGFAHIGNDKDGQPLYRYCEWWLVYEV